MTATARRLIGLTVAASLLAGGCASGPTPVGQRSAQQKSAFSCVRLPKPGQQPGGAAQAGSSPQQPAAARQAGASPQDGPAASATRAAQPVSLPGFSDEAVRTARDIGVLPLLERFAALPGYEAATSDALRAQSMHTRQRLSDRVLLALLDVQGVLAELECERDRGSRVQFILAEAQGRRDRRLALSGLVVGALTTILSGGLALGVPDSNGADVVGILGGSAEAGVGAAGLSGEATAQLRTERNALREVWDGSGGGDSPVFPPTVWRLFTKPGDAREPSVREALVAQWRATDQLDDAPEDERRRRVELLFGEGGRYTSDDLQLRETLLDSLQARIWLISIQLERLMREILLRPEDSPAR